MPFVVEWVNQCRGRQATQIITMPAGALQVHSCDEVILATEWVIQDHADQTGAGASSSLLADQLNRYWTQPDECINLKLLKKGSPYQFKVWQELMGIKFGATCSYKELAGRINSAPRPIGGACRANQFPFIIPCHRIISVAGAGGYAGQKKGWLMNIKLKLLEYEWKCLHDASASSH